METFLIIISLILFLVCLFQAEKISNYKKDFDIVRKRVWKLADKYNINEEDIHSIFHERNMDGE